MFEKLTNVGRHGLLARVGAVNANYPMRCDEGSDAYHQRIGQLGRNLHTLVKRQPLPTTWLVPLSILARVIRLGLGKSETDRHQYDQTTCITVPPLAIHSLIG